MPRLSLFATFASLLVASHGLGSAVAAKEGSDGKGSNRAAESAVARWLEENQDRPTSLRAFVQRMPKGGDIHSHLSGAVYAEHYLEWAAADGLCWTPPHPPWYRQAPVEKSADSLPLPS